MYSTEIENFCGVYMLYCLNEQYKGRTYIGFTVNPNRRLKQHNAGRLHGGAKRTSEKGPWYNKHNQLNAYDEHDFDSPWFSKFHCSAPVYCITRQENESFPAGRKMTIRAADEVHHLPARCDPFSCGFEWAWQNPHLSRRLKHLAKKGRTQRVFDFQLTILSAMLQVGPWNRLPLMIRWLDEDFGLKFSDRVCAPLHMPVVFGKVKAKKLTKQKEGEQLRESKSADTTCSICGLIIIKPKQRVECINPQCRLIAHLVCLAEIFTKDDGRILPVAGDCPSCNVNVLWGDLIRKKIGCNFHLQPNEESDYD